MKQRMNESSGDRRGRVSVIFGWIRQWITGGPLYVAYTLSFIPLETRRVTQIPNTCAFCREGCRGGSPTHPLLESATTMAGPRRLSVLVHKIRLVSLKSVVQDIGRAYIKNRHRDEWIAVASWQLSFPKNISRGLSTRSSSIVIVVVVVVVVASTRGCQLIFSLEFLSTFLPRTSDCPHVY